MSDNIIEIINTEYTFEIENSDTNVIEMADYTYDISVDNLINISYNDAADKPKINNVELSGNKSSSDLSLASSSDLLLKENLSNKVTGLTSDVTDTQYPSAKSVYDKLQTKQDSLVSGQNIKTLNSETLLGNTDITLANPDLSNLSTAGEAHFDSRYVNASGDTISGALTVQNYLTISSNDSGLEGGQIDFGKGASETLSGNICLDRYNDRLRIFDSTGVVMAEFDFVNNKVHGSPMAATCMPSSSYATLTLGASGSQYTASHNGWVYCQTISVAGTTPALGLQNISSNIGTLIRAESNIAGKYMATYLPVKKGDIYSITYSSINTASTTFLLSAANAET